MRRLGIALLVVAAMAAFPMVGSHAGLTGPESVWMLHGLGGDFAGPVDVYLGDPDATDWILLEEDLEFNEFVDTGSAAATGYNILACEAVAAPLASITGCADNATPSVNGNFGTNIEIPDTLSATVVLSYSDPSGPVAGRPTVAVFENDLSCVDTAETGRAALSHAAAASPVDVLVDGTPIVEDLAWGEAENLDVPAGEYNAAVELTDGTPVLDAPNTPVDGQTLNSLFVVGNPQFNAEFEVLRTELPLELCEQPTTTTAPPIAPVTPAQQVQPTFTG